MLYNERIELILQQLQLQGIVKISDLTELLAGCVCGHSTAGFKDHGAEQPGPVCPGRRLSAGLSDFDFRFFGTSDR